ncbi:MAG: hypothetical protein AAF721_36100 [Myxococcota bacterium]
MRACGLLATLALAGCVGPSEASCPAARVLFNGECCAPWAVADLDVCLVTAWDTPAADAGIGAGGARDPEVAVDALGRVVVAWTEVSESTTTVTLAEQDADGTFEFLTPAQELPGNSNSPSLTTDARGRVLLSWRQQLGEGGSVHYAERDLAGAWHLPPDTLQLSYGTTAYEPRSVYAEDGEALVVFNQWTGANFGVAVARRGKERLEGALAPPDAHSILSPPVLFANAPVPAVASNGDAIITWYQSPGQSLMTFVSERFGADGAFSRPAADDFISVDGAPVDSHPESNPAPAIHDRGSAVVAWTQENGAGHTPVFLASRTGHGEWTLPESLDDSFSTPGGAARCAQSVFGGDGSLYVAWYEEDPAGALRVFAAHRAPDGTWVDAGREPTQLSTEGADGIHPAVAVGPEGQALIAYAERVADTWQLVVRRRNPGRAVWLAPEVLSGALTGDASEPTVAWRNGLFVVAWVHGDIDNRRIHFARVLPGAEDSDAP